MSTVQVSGASLFADAIADPAASSTDLFRLIAQELQDAAGAKLVTVTAVDPVDQSYERLFTTNAEVYPVAGRKPANVTDWNKTVMGNHEVFVANDYESLSKAMFDHETIRALGCESIVNVPLVLFGRVIGTLNCLGVSGNFSEDRVRVCKDMRLPVMFGLLLAAAGPEDARP